MLENKDTQAAFMEAINSLKEFAKVNGGYITKEDVLSYFKDMELDDSKLQMIYGYLMANNIKIKGEMSVDNTFLKMMEDSSAKAATDALADDGGEFPGVAMPGSLNTGSENDYDEELAKKETVPVEDHLNYEEDNKYLSLYLEDLKSIESLSDTTRAYLLMNIVEDNDKESLRLLSESFLERIVEWIEPYRQKGVLASDLVQEANLAMMSYVSERRWESNYEWKDKIKEGSTDDLIYVMHGIEDAVCEEVKGCLQRLLEEQIQENQVSGRVLGKVNLVNDWAVRLREDLGRKPTIQEVADKMGISVENVREAIQLSAEAIEEIDYVKTEPTKKG